MECKFVIGQKVLCIHDDEDPDLKIGSVYTIAGFHPISYNANGKPYLGLCVSLEEFHPGHLCFPHECFKALDDARLGWARELCRVKAPFSADLVDFVRDLLF